MSCASAWRGCSTWASWSTWAARIAWPPASGSSTTSPVRVQQYPGNEVSDVRTGFATERAFVENHAAALLDLEDLKTIRQRIEDRLRWEYSKETGMLLDEKEPAPTLDFSDIEKKYSSAFGGSALEGSRFSSSKLGVTLMLIEVGGFSTSAAQSAALIERVRADMKALGGPERYAPGMRVGFTGDVAISAEETAALMEDLTLSSVLVVVTVLLAIVLFYGWGRSIPALFLPLGVAAVYAFALASLPPFGITELNSNTAFLGSIIIGNGINFGIIQLARYVEARRHGETVEDALALSLWATRKGTLSAALAAGVAYASLIAMQFRGFRQFGVIGGLGMLLAWGTTYLLMPPLLVWLDRGQFAPKPRWQARGLMTRDRARRGGPPARVRRWARWSSRCSPPGRCAGSGATSWSTTSRACAGTTPGRRARATGARRWTCCSTAT